MILVYLFEFLVVGLGIIFAATQIVIPLWRGTPIFPIFRKERKLVKELSEAKGEVREAELVKNIHEERKQAEEIKKASGGT